jgi:ATP-dependent exoDNAse (exonuclease V) alpha subunit
MYGRIVLNTADRFARFVDATAGTAHSAQGITLDAVFVDARDIRCCPIKQSLGYVAVSRARSEVHLLAPEVAR